MLNNGFTQLFSIKYLGASINDQARVMASNIKNVLQLYPQHLNSTLKAFSQRLSSVDENFVGCFKGLNSYFVECQEEGQEATIKKIFDFASNEDSALKRFAMGLILYCDDLSLWDSKKILA